MITLSQSKAFENFPATLEVRVLDWFNAALKSAPAKFTGLNLADFFKAGNYNVNVAIDQGADEDSVLSACFKSDLVDES